jgi:5'-nucleotidase
MVRKNPRILVVNDDGFHGEGLAPLIDALRPLGQVTVLVPEKERSAGSHSLTLHKPLRVRGHRGGIQTVNGGPADAARLGALKLLRGRVDLIVSGINQGYNLGQDTIYSGTVAAAMEGTLIGIPSFAISRGERGKRDFGPAAEIAQRVAKQILRRSLPSGICLNVNVPPLPMSKIKTAKVVRLGERIYEKTITERRDPQGGRYYWLMGKSTRGLRQPGTDVDAVRLGHVSLTPLSADNTHRGSMPGLRRWKL